MAYVARSKRGMEVQANRANRIIRELPSDASNNVYYPVHGDSSGSNDGILWSSSPTTTTTNTFDWYSLYVPNLPDDKKETKHRRRSTLQDTYNLKRKHDGVRRINRKEWGFLHYP